MPGTQLASDLRKGCETMQKGIDQRAAIAIVVGRSRAGVNHHAGRLVDHGEVVIFVDDIERNILGDRA